MSGTGKGRARRKRVWVLYIHDYPYSVDDVLARLVSRSKRIDRSRIVEFIEAPRKRKAKVAR